MKSRLLSFTFIYWLAVIVFIIIVSYVSGKERLTKYEFTQGKVVDKILLRVKSGIRSGTYDAYFSQWQYTVGQDTFLFVDRQSFSRLKKIGTTSRVIYLKDNYYAARVYSPDFWISLPFILITIMIALFIFAIRQFVVHWNDKAWFGRWYRRT